MQQLGNTVSVVFNERPERCLVFQIFIYQQHCVKNAMECERTPFADLHEFDITYLFFVSEVISI